MKKWIIGRPDKEVIAKLQDSSDLSEICCTVLASRGCTTVQSANAMIGCQELSSPFLLRDMQEAADCINQAIDNDRKICVYGDYDCDGVMASAILFTFLRESGANVVWRIPERMEGYGLNETAIQEMHDDGVELIVTVDNGISAVAEAKRIAELGMKLVITDHHQPGPELPMAEAVVDAHRTDNMSPFRLYCGAGIALLLVAAINGGDTDMAMEQFGDLAAIATIGDVVSLTGENRYIVHMGLQYLENTERPGLRALREISTKAGTPLTSVNVAFTLVPRINAAGRMESPKLAMELILEEDPKRAVVLAQQIQNLNTARHEKEAEIINAVMEQAEQEPQLLHERVLIFSGKDWHGGIMGIVASRMEERFGKPCFIVSIMGDLAHGSARSFGDFSVFDCLSACAPLLLKFGGHPAAGGFTLEAEKLPEFRKAVAAYALEKHREMPFLELPAVCSIDPAMLVPEEIETLTVLEPFGAGQPEPVFLLENAQIQNMQGVSGGVHTRFLLKVQNRNYDAILFRTAPEQTGLKPGDVCHLMVKIQIHTFQGIKRISLQIQDYRKSGLKQGKLLMASQTYDMYRRGEGLPDAYYTALCPSHEDCTAIYKAVPKNGISTEQLAQQMFFRNINFGKLRICLDAFCELGLMQLTDGESRVIPVPTRSKVSLQDSQILKNIAAKSGRNSI